MEYKEITLKDIGVVAGKGGGRKADRTLMMLKNAARSEGKNLCLVLGKEDFIAEVIKLEDAKANRVRISCFYVNTADKVVARWEDAPTVRYVIKDRSRTGVPYYENPPSKG